MSDRKPLVPPFRAVPGMEAEFSAFRARIAELEEEKHKLAWSRDERIADLEAERDDLLEEVTLASEVHREAEKLWEADRDRLESHIERAKVLAENMRLDPAAYDDVELLAMDFLAALEGKAE